MGPFLGRVFVELVRVSSAQRTTPTPSLEDLSNPLDECP